MVAGVNGTLEDEVNVEESKEGTTPIPCTIYSCNGLTDEHAAHKSVHLVRVRRVRLGLRSTKKQSFPCLRDYVRIAWSRGCVPSTTSLNLKFLSRHSGPVTGNPKSSATPSAARCAHPASNTLILTVEEGLRVAITRK